MESNEVFFRGSFVFLGFDQPLTIINHQPCMVYSATFTIESNQNAGKYTSPMDGMGYKDAYYLLGN